MKKKLTFLALLTLNAQAGDLFSSNGSNSFFEVRQNIETEQHISAASDLHNLLNDSKFSLEAENAADNNNAASFKPKSELKPNGETNKNLKIDLLADKVVGTNPETINGIYVKHAPKSCFDEAGAYHGVDPWVLFSIAKVESDFNPKARNINKDSAKSLDFGMMQINSYWYPKLAKKGITKEMLADPCVSTFVGAWILRQNIDTYGNGWKAIGAYNAVSEHKQIIYYNKIVKAHRELTKEARKRQKG